MTNMTRQRMLLKHGFINLTFRMLQHTSSEVTVGGKNANKYKRNVKDWYLIRKMKCKQTDFSMKSAKQTKPS